MSSLFAAFSDNLVLVSTNRTMRREAAAWGVRAWRTSADKGENNEYHRCASAYTCDTTMFSTGPRKHYVRPWSQQTMHISSRCIPSGHEKNVNAYRQFI